jgi:putative tryptophan/tyrosine transport system substrate-binding protein
MTRCEFITLLGGAAAMWPLAARAQQPGRLIRLGLLGPTLNNPPAIAQYQAFRTQLGDRRQVAVITTFGGMAVTLAAKAATATIPIVFVAAEDPVKLVLSPASPVRAATSQASIF